MLRIYWFHFSPAPTKHPYASNSYSFNRYYLCIIFLLVVADEFCECHNVYRLATVVFLHQYKVLYESFILQVRAQHLERAVDFLVKELKVCTPKEANERIFFVSAKETLQARLNEEKGMPPHSKTLTYLFYLFVFIVQIWNNGLYFMNEIFYLRWCAGRGFP